MQRWVIPLPFSDWCSTMDAEAISIDLKLLERFEDGIDPLKPHESAIPARIIGYGEISTIFEILEPSFAGFACKRLPVFRTEDEMQEYEQLFHEYNRVLSEEIGIKVPRYASARVIPPKGNRVVYCIQERLLPGAIGNRLIHTLPIDSVVVLFRAVLAEMAKVWAYNASQDRVRLGLDAQISNWALSCDTVPGDLKEGGVELVYIDTSTPLMRVYGVEQLNTELFLRGAPSFLVWFIRLFFLKDVVGRYYDFHLAVVDLLANLYKEGRPDLIEPLIRETNRFFSCNASGLDANPVTYREVRSYYREDAMIWRLYQWLRRFDRFLQTRLLRRHYCHILPGAIKR